MPAKGSRRMLREEFKVQFRNPAPRGLPDASLRKAVEGVLTSAKATDVYNHAHRVARDIVGLNQRQAARVARIVTKDRGERLGFAAYASARDAGASHTQSFKAYRAEVRTLGYSRAPGVAGRATSASGAVLGAASKVVGYGLAPALLAYGSYTGAQRDAHRLRGAARGALSALDPTAPINALLGGDGRGLIERGFDRAFGRAMLPTAHLNGAALGRDLDARRQVNSNQFVAPTPMTFERTYTKGPKAGTTEIVTRVQGRGAEHR